MLANMLLRVMSAPPVLVDDTAETDAATVTSGNVLSNDTGTLTVVAVNGLSVNVGEEIAGSNGGDFVISADGSWTFDPSGDFAALSGTDTTATSVNYHASNGQAEASATLTVTVSAPAQPEVRPVLAIPMTGLSGGTTFTDLMGHTVTRGTPIYVEAGVGPQGISSYARFISTASYLDRPLVVPNSSDFIIGSNDFCIDFFIKWNTFINDTVRYEPCFPYILGSLMFFNINKKITTRVVSSGVSTAVVNAYPNPVAVGAWAYFRLNKSGTTYRLYINGSKVVESTGPLTIDPPTGDIEILSAAGLAGVRCDISMSHFRFFVGASLDTTDTITIPTIPYTY